MILTYKTKIGAMLRKTGNDEACTLFEKETRTLEENINREVGDKCFYSALFGVVITAIIFGGAFYYVAKNNNTVFFEQLKEASR